MRAARRGRCRQLRGRLGTVRPPRWHCTAPQPYAAQGPLQARRTRNPLLQALMAIRWPKWKITGSPGPSLELAAAELAVCCSRGGGVNPGSPHEHPRGPGAVSQSLGVCRHPRDGMRTGAGGVASQGAPGESPPALSQLSHGPGNPRERRAVLSLWEQTVPRVLVWRPLGGDLKGARSRAAPAPAW